MLRQIIDHEGISEHSAGLTFRRGDISWALRRKLVVVQPRRDWTELVVTDAGRKLVDGQTT